MRFLQPLLLVGIVVLAACSSSRKIAGTPSKLDGQWQLAVWMPAQKKTLAEVFGDRTVELNFSKDTASGTTGCNRFSGSYTADTANLTFSQQRALTRMACPNYNEQLVLDALNRVNRYRLVESQLELQHDKEILMIFARRPATNQ